MSLELGASLESAVALSGRSSRWSAFDGIVIVSWGELTSSKLLAQSYGEADTRVLSLVPYPLSQIDIDNAVV